MNRMARQGEADRHQTGSLIKHLVSFFILSSLFSAGANNCSDCRKAWYRKDQPQISRPEVFRVLALRVCRWGKSWLAFGMH
jgi:hypothetical protein